MHESGQVKVVSRVWDTLGSLLAASLLIFTIIFTITVIHFSGPWGASRQETGAHWSAIVILGGD